MGIIIDGGAGVGEWIDPKWHKSDTFYCFEPLTANFEALKRWAKDKPNVTLVKAALGGFNGSASIFCGPQPEPHVYWGGSICEDKDAEWPARETVEVIKLSDYWKDNINETVQLLKMNIEGPEYDVFEDLLDVGIINEFETIQYQDHGVRGLKVIPSCRDKGLEIYPRLIKEHTGTIEFIVGSIHGLTTDVPEYLRKDEE